MEVLAAIALVSKLVMGIRNAIVAGSSTVSESDIDAALAEIAASDDRLSDAIRRAREREDGQ